ncbi:hypothetical protein HPB49_016676 [Dermacentor silvarum]|uniref:Uncharacterized protein n=1 Tax=Dermacentor silvarum TaxID=543639 RepID=A0ACB8CYY1_DERSI|nr:hypothetical protein HPB49_016676 [Dermacentor silvarum]
MDGLPEHQTFPGYAARCNAYFASADCPFPTSWSPRTLHDALSVSVALTTAEARAATVDIKNETNLAIISSDDPSATEKLQRINETTVNGKTYPVHIYIASPHNSCRGVIHNV